MKKILLVSVLFVMFAVLFAGITPYGGASVGFWYEMTDEDHEKGDRLDFNSLLQENSYFGVEFKRLETLHGKVEFGYNADDGKISVNQLWARKSFRNNWALVIGKDDFGTTVLANQGWNGLGLDGYGGMDAGGIPQIRFELNIDNDILYLALMQPNVKVPLSTGRDFQPMSNLSESDFDVLIPRIMVGYNVYHRDFKLQPMAMLQMYSLNEDIAKERMPNMPNSASIDQDPIYSWMLAITAKYHAAPFELKLHAHYGQNLGLLGLGGTFCTPFGHLGHSDGKWGLHTAHAASLGGFVAVGYDINEAFNVNAGFGYATSESSSGAQVRNEEGHLKRLDGNHDDRMAFFLQGIYNFGNFSIVPEFGMFMEGQDLLENEQGSMMYFGTQLRYEF